MNCKVIKKSGNPPFLHQPPLYSFVPLSSKKFRTPPPPQVTPLIRGGGFQQWQCHSHDSQYHFLWYPQKFYQSSTFAKDFETSLSFYCSFLLWLSMKISLTFCFTKRSNTCRNVPPPPQQKQIKASLLKACGFSVVMFGNTLIANQCFVECIIFYLPIMTSQ